MAEARATLALTGLLLVGCTDRELADTAVTIAGDTMGTTYQVKVVPAAGHAVETTSTKARIDALLEEVNDQMSTYRPSSELSRFNADDSDGWFAVSAATAQTVRLALEISDQTAGAYDVTAGPLINLWSFGPEGGVGQLPDEQEVHDARHRVGYEALDVRDDPPALRKARAGLYVDLSSIAKGWAVDRVSELLTELGYGDHFVEIGGETRARGVSGRGDSWKVAIEAPQRGGLAIQRVLPLDDASIATSGDYRNYFEIDGKSYSHIIDPRTGHPVDHRLASVTVIERDCARADALATAMMVLGPDEALHLADEAGLAVLLIERTATGFVERASRAWSDRMDGAA